MDWKFYDPFNTRRKQGLRLLLISAVFILSNSVWIKNRSDHYLSLCVSQSGKAAIAPCGWGSYTASRLVAHPNRPGLIFTHTPQVTVRNAVPWMIKQSQDDYIMIHFYPHSLQIRSTYLKHRPKVKFLCGVWPMLHIGSQKASWGRLEKRKMDQSQTSNRQRSSQWASAAAGSDRRLSVWFPCFPLQAPFAKCIIEKAAKRRKDYVSPH